MQEKHYKYQPAVLLFTGLSASGKSTLAYALKEVLAKKAYQSYVLDGDHLRSGLNADLDFSLEARNENLRRIAEVAKLFLDVGFITLIASIAPLREQRENMRRLFPQNIFLEIYCQVDISICQARDPKGLYKQARAGKINIFTGISSPYEVPKNPDLCLDTHNLSIQACLQQLIYFLLSKNIITNVS